MFRWRDCLEGHILIGLVLSLISWVMLTLVTFSTPYIKSIYFLTSPTPQLKFGAFGYCSLLDCVGPQLGYEQDGGEIIRWLTGSMILFGLAALFMLLAWITLILSLLRVGKFMWNPVYFRTAALLGSFMAILAESFALALFVTARKRYDDQGIRATYGAALWLGLIGAISAFLGAAIGGPAYQGHYMYRAHPAQAYNV
ncbi:hypothetical protein I302_107250 [Kwoniella bestiolae CBS 10118]|uniref:Uncharacterized protein n=1 Tax=Kwoniella bestiolae CBS 10118 TaxID=1296100 RepID=A0A1B9FZ32_9TREE|nr:hypothetical protein I302_07015 [Kwoniella bestiolae CBS 10118]OCF24029.1 hypothetical protein I302_07015 [Kwoniella bestiolae CBS 10118]